jgi:hypothetical protein
MNRGSINHGLMKNVHSSQVKESRIKCSGYRIHTPVTWIISTTKDMKLADISRRK